MSVRSWLYERVRPITRSLGARYRRTQHAVVRAVFGPPPKVGHVYRDVLIGETVYICSKSSRRVQITTDSTRNIDHASSVSRSMLYAALEIGLIEHDDACPQCTR